MSADQSSGQDTGLGTKGYILLIIAMLGWGTSWPFIKLGLNEIPPWTYRGLIAPAAATLIFGFILLSRRKFVWPTGQWKVLIVASLLNISGWHVFSALGLRELGAGHGAIIAYTMPLWAANFSVCFLGERLTAARWIGLAIGIAGLGVLLTGELGVIQSAPVGAMLMIFAAFFWAAGTVVQKRIAWTLPALQLVGWQLVIGGLPITITALFIESSQWAPVSSTAVWSTVYVLLVPIMLSWFCWFQVVERVPVTVSTVSTLSAPILGVISSAYVLGEAVGWREVVSLLLICSALVLVLSPVRNSGGPKRFQAG